MHPRGSDAAAALRRLKAARLRAGGMSFRDIGEALGVSHTQARADYRAGLKALHGRLGKRVEELTLLELERLELPVAGLKPAVEAGDPQAVDAWRKLSESRRKLLGLDAPDVVALGGEVTVRRYIGVDVEGGDGP
jgi:hypothetical protein